MINDGEGHDPGMYYVSHHMVDHVVEWHVALSQTLYFFDAWKGRDPACSREITRSWAPSVYKAIPFNHESLYFYNLDLCGALNAVVDGYRYTKNRTCKEIVYYCCVEQSTCSIPITQTDGVLFSPSPDHSHPSLGAAIAVFGMKNHIKKRSAETDMPTKEIVADSLGTLDFEGMAKLNCQINALSKMSR